MCLRSRPTRLPDVEGALRPRAIHVMAAAMLNPMATDHRIEFVASMTLCDCAGNRASGTASIVNGDQHFVGMSYKLIRTAPTPADSPWLAVRIVSAYVADDWRQYSTLVERFDENANLQGTRWDVRSASFCQFLG